MISLTLGFITFQDYEVPERINFGGDQSLAVHQLVGGQRVIDVMGRVDDDISWSGLFFGENALPRAQFLDALRVQGLELPLVYSNFNYLVVIKSFTCSFERTYQVKYNITVTVLQNLNLPFSLNNPLSFTTAILELMNQANSLTAAINIPSVTAAMGGLNTSVNAVPSFDNASNAQLNLVYNSVTNANAATSSSISSINSGLFPT